MPPVSSVRAPRFRARPFLATLTFALAAGGLAACGPQPTIPATPGPQATTTGGAGGSGGGGGSATIAPVQPGEANVIKGRVTTELGAPVPDATIRVIGFTGGANLGQEIENVETGADGGYRFQAPSGLYELLGEGGLDFDGQRYLFELDPVDGDCGQAESAGGIVKDFVLRLTGLVVCVPGGGVDPESHVFYHGASIQLFNALAGVHDPASVIEFTLEPTSPLADGSAGETLTLTRTVAALSTSAGPLEDTWILHDIPLARYRVSATLTEPGGSPAPLWLETQETSAASEVDLVFPAGNVLGTPKVGYQMPSLWVSEAP